METFISVVFYNTAHQGATDGRGSRGIDFAPSRHKHLTMLSMNLKRSWHPFYLRIISCSSDLRALEYFNNIKEPLLGFKCSLRYLEKGFLFSLLVSTTHLWRYRHIKHDSFFDFKYLTIFRSTAQS